jgi:hypothetical protein
VPFRNVAGETDTPKALCDPRSELTHGLGPALYGISQNVPYFILHAPRVPLRSPLQLLCDVILEISNHELRHAPRLQPDDITISYRPTILAALKIVLGRSRS